MIAILAGIGVLVLGVVMVLGVLAYMAWMAWRGLF